MLKIGDIVKIKEGAVKEHFGLGVAISLGVLKKDCAEHEYKVVELDGNIGVYLDMKNSLIPMWFPNEWLEKVEHNEPVNDDKPIDDDTKEKLKEILSKPSVDLDKLESIIGKIELPENNGVEITIKYDGETINIDSEVELDIENKHHDALYGIVEALYSLLGVKFDD